MDPLTIAQWFLSKEAMSPKKLQKLIYYAYAWYLTLMNDEVDYLNRTLFHEDMVAWPHGPVVYSVFKHYRDYNLTEIPKETVDESVFPVDTLDILSQVWDVYGGYTADELQSIVHQEDPWLEAREGLTPLQSTTHVIQDTTLFEYYSQGLR